MLKNDYILVTSGASTAENLGFIGKVLKIVNDPTGTDSFPYKVYFNGYRCWVNGVPVTDLIKALA